MTTDSTLRRRAGQRISGAVWGLLVMGAGALSAAAYSGYEIDLELAAIILLAALGGWLLLSAALSGLGRKREVARATAPTVEEPVSDAAQPGDATDAEDADEASDAREEDAEAADEGDRGRP